MTRVDDIYKDLELLINEYKVYHRVIDENIRLTNAIEDIKAEIDERWHEALKDDIRFAEGLEVADMIIDKYIGKESHEKETY